MIGLKGFSINEKVFQNHATAVFRGVRESDQTSIIAKVLTAEFPSSKELASFMRQYELAKNMKAEHVVEIHSVEKLGNTLAIIMRDFGGESLKTIVAEKMSLPEKLHLARKIALALDEIHSQGILHNDFNPANILINRITGDVKIIDFELASVFKHRSQQLKSPDKIEGTLAYISPERTGRMNRPVDYRSDYYSLGVTIYELLSGSRPFETGDLMEMVHMHIAVMPQSLHDRDKSIPLAVSLITGKLLEKNAEHRYQSVAGVVKDLDICIEALTNGGHLQGFTPGKHDVLDKFTIPSKLYGREKDVEVLTEYFERVCRGVRGLALVTGRSGVGKSTLVNEIHKPITRKRGYFAMGKYDQFQRNIPYTSFIQAFQDILRQILTESGERIASWRERILAAAGGNGKLLIDVIPELQHIIGQQPEVPALQPQEAANRFNYYFRNFVQVFANADHPLVLFLDDLQWADNPSLNLIELLASDRNCANLLLIGAYRENEVENSHPLKRAIDRMKNGGVEINSISLQDLSVETVCEITADTLNCSASEARQLAELIHKKSGGTPFFVNQLLKYLHDNNLVTYNYDAGRWTWDIGKIGAVAISDNVVELMTGKIRTLPSQTQEILKLAACAGAHFTLRGISDISGVPDEAISKSFNLALKEELIVPLEGDDKFDDLQASFGFLHDRIQQAAYDLLSPDEKAKAHLKAGEVLLGGYADNQLDANIFVVVNHFNQAIELIRDAALRIRLAGLNLKAASKAKSAVAYQPALEHIKMAQAYIAGLESENRNLSFRLLVERAECEYLSGNAGTAEELYAKSIKEASSQKEKAEVYESMIHFYSNTGDFKRAYEIGRQGLKGMGVSLPGKFVPPLFLADLIKLKWKMRGKTTKDLINLPLCKDEEKATAMRLIGALLKASYQIRPELCIANAVKAVNLSLDFGNIEDNAVAYMVFGGIFIGGVIGNHKAGYDYGRLALALNSRFDNIKQRSEVNFISGYFTNFWLEHARNTEEYYKAAYENGLQSGDFFHLSCAACTLAESQFIRGVPMQEVKTLCEDNLAFMRRINSKEAAGAINAVLRAILNLEGMTENSASFGDGGFSEKEYAEEIKGFTSLHFSHFYFVNKMTALYLWGRYEEALETAIESEKYLKYSLAMLHTAEHHFWHALILLSAYDLRKDRALLKKARKILSKFEKWGKLNPSNFGHKALLLKAEIERRTGPAGLSVSHLYNEAIQSADENGYMNIKALGNELAGRYFAANNIIVAAREHLREARYLYTGWGAKGIAGKLEREFPQFLSLAPGFQSGQSHFAEKDTSRTKKETTTSGGKDNSGLDLESIMKSTQAISSEIRLAALLEKMMEVIIENAGAERGYFIRVDNEIMYLEAEGAVGKTALTFLEQSQMDERKAPVSILRYVARTRESVVLGDASSGHSFGNDPYFLNESKKSALCAPVIHQGKVTGIVYLENNLVTNAFNPERVSVIQVIAGQVASAVANARLYADMEQKVIERTAGLQKAKETAEEATKMKDKFVSLASHDLRSPLCNIVTTMNILRNSGDSMKGEDKSTLEKMVIDNTEAMLRLIEQLLDITRFKAGRIDLRKRPVFVKHLFSEIAAGAAQLAEKKGTRIENNLPDDYLLIADTVLFREVLHNLVTNAIKFSSEGDVITVYCGAPGENTIYVKDTGTGIAPSMLPDLFKSEVKTSTRGTHGERGTGLGLPYCYDIIKAHGGEITVESKLGKGSVFKIDLPLFDVLILIADDQEAHRKMMKEIIRDSMNAEFLEADNGKEALSLLNNITPDLIISDINMPEMDGFEFLGKARSMERIAQTPIMIATSAETSNTAEETARVKALSLGANGLIIKPVVAKEFISMVLQLMVESKANVRN